MAGNDNDGNVYGGSRADIFGPSDVPGFDPEFLSMQLGTNMWMKFHDSVGDFVIVEGDEEVFRVTAEDRELLVAGLKQWLAETRAANDTSPAKRSCADWAE